jgi:hypothetical protein
MNTFIIRLITTSVYAAMTAVGLGPILGCGDDTGLDRRYPVSGTVTYNNKPLEKGQIAFIPTDPSKQRPANGTIVDGRYTLTTATSGDGALPGTYKVSVVSKQIRPEDEARIKETLAKIGGTTRQQLTGRATARAKDLIPAKYQSSEMSGLEATVGPKSNTLNFPLTD